MTIMNLDNIPHIGLEYPDVYPTELITQEVDLISNLGYKIDLRKTEPMGMMASLDWAIGTGFVIYLLKPYFEAFLQEAGKDHYTIIKKKLSDYVIHKRRIKTTVVTASTSPDKINKNYEQSRTISIKAILGKSVSITVLINEEIGELQLSEALSSAFDELLRLQTEVNKLEAEQPDRHQKDKVLQMYMLLHPENKSWELLTFSQMIERYRGNAMSR
jgi:hypothetical protein